MYAMAGGPKWMKAATKSLATLCAVQQQGDTLQTYAFFTDNTGTIVAPFKPIQNARQAWIKWGGKRYEVCRIAGFSSLYNVVRLQTTGIKKNSCLPYTQQSFVKGETLYLMPQGIADEVTQVEKAGSYDYYTLKSLANPKWVGAPVISESGQVAGILQAPLTTTNAPYYALDIRFALELTIRSIDANHADLRNCSIPKLLPTDEEQASSFLYLASTLKPEERITYAEDFIRLFPQNSTGYLQKAEAQTVMGSLSDTWTTYEQALKLLPTKSDEILYARARAIYNKVLQQPQTNEGWTLEQALTDINEAIQKNPQPLYTLHKANVLYAQKQYNEAYKHFMELSQTPMRSAEFFLYAWQCKRNLQADNEELLALNDSALVCFAKPYPTEAAPYLYLRSNTLRDMGRLREAISDQNEYEHLMVGQQLTAEFYYQREQMEVQVRMFGPAVNDIQRALALAPQEPVFHAESAVLLIRLGDLDTAITECQRAAELDADFPDAYRLWGICLREKGDKTGARKQLQKAIELGDTLAQKLLDGLAE